MILILICLFHITLSYELLSNQRCDVYPSYHNEKRLICTGFYGELALTDITTNSSNVTQLYFNENNITSLKESSGENFIAVRELGLNGNNINYINVDAFESLPNLRKLDMSYNKIDELHENLFESNEALESIDLTGNNIKYLKVKSILRLKNLKEIVLSDNPLELCDSATLNTLNILHVMNVHTFIRKTCESNATINDNSPLLQRTKSLNNGNNDKQFVQTLNSNATRSLLYSMLPIKYIFFTFSALSVLLLFVVVFLYIYIRNFTQSSANSNSAHANYRMSRNLLLSQNSLPSETGDLNDDLYLTPTVPKIIHHYIPVIEDTQAENMRIYPDGLLQEPKHIYEEIYDSDAIYYKANSCYVHHGKMAPVP